MNEYLISVVIPTYNREKTIERAVQSVLDQSYSYLEVIIVDDGSTDHTEEIVQNIQDERVQFHKLHHNCGAGHARNEGVKLAKGEIVAFHDSDDVWRPDKLQRQMEYWHAHPEYSMIYCMYMSHGENGKVTHMPYNGMKGKLEGDLFYSLMFRNSIGTPTMLLKKEYFFECGGFDDSLRCLEDWEFALRFSKEYLVGYLNEIHVDVYKTQGSVSSEVGGFFEARCKMIVEHKDEMIRIGVFDEIVTDLFVRAEKLDILERVKEMFMLMLCDE